jgi:hypothetical protein
MLAQPSNGNAWNEAFTVKCRLLPFRFRRVADLNGTDHECVAEAFDTTRNVIILMYPVLALTATTIVLPSNFRQRCSS